MHARKDTVEMVLTVEVCKGLSAFLNTMKPPNKGHFGTSHFLEVILLKGVQKSVFCWEVVHPGGFFIKGSTVPCQDNT